MLKYAAQRLLWMVPVLFGVGTSTFVLMHAVPGGPWDEKKNLPPLVVANLNQRYDLDDPLWLQYGKFLTAIFDEWVRKDVGKVYVQIFDTALEAWMGMNPSLCVFSETCGKGLAMEHNGDLYSCDHYVYPEYHLGNIMDKPIDEMVDSLQQRKFGTDKRDSLPKMCRECDVLFVCHGECPKNRFISTPDGEPGLNYLCDGLYHFFKYIDAPMSYMANELRAQRSPANVMHYMRQRDLMMAGKSEPAPNDPCHCGSGKKFKKCHGGKVAALKG